MAFLLGTETCIESLRKDLCDIQETLNTIERSVPAKCYSWKSPDKLASDVDIVQLLERHTYGSDEVENQVAHYTLLELVIDRLLFLMYQSTVNMDTLLEKQQNTKLIISLTAGLVTKRYWNKFSQLCCSFRQLNSQKAKPIEEVPKINVVKSKYDEAIKHIKTKQHVSDEICFKGTQTVETAFVPCESCAKIQSNLKQIADLVINMCHYQNIQSHVAKYRSSLMINQLTGGWLNGPDIEKWLVEQDKDLQLISKQLDYLAKNNEFLKGKLKENEATVAKMTTSEKELKKAIKDEQDAKAITMKQYEKKLVDQKTELQTKIASLEDEIKKLNTLNTSLHLKIDDLNSINQNQTKAITELTRTNNELMTHRTTQEQKCQQLEAEKVKCLTELECAQKEMEKVLNELNGERTKLEQAIRNEQSLILKNEMLAESNDKQSAEIETLKKRVMTFDDERKSSKKDLEDKIESLEANNFALQQNIDNLKEDYDKMKKNETLLLKYPDLYGPMENIANENENVIDDMRNQIKANKYRMSLLENLNNTLNNSIQKLEKQQQISSGPKEEEKPQPVEESISIKYQAERPFPLFKLENELDEKIPYEREESKVKKAMYQESDQGYDFMSEKRQSDKEFLARLNQINNNANTELCIDFEQMRIPSSRISSSMSTSKPTSPLKSNIMKTPIPPAEKQMEVIVGCGRIRRTSRPGSNASTKRDLPPTPKSNKIVSSFKCLNCDKAYSNTKDFEIHKIYCK